MSFALTVKKHNMFFNLFFLRWTFASDLNLLCALDSLVEKGVYDKIVGNKQVFNFINK